MILAAGAVGVLASALLVPHVGVAQQSRADGAGYCRDAGGVTVVADFTDLGGDIVVRCVRGSGFTGLVALQRAGLAPAGTQRYGLSYVCRLAGRPAIDEVLPIKDHEDYTESCVNTPPLTAYWSYSYAPNGGAWRYSSSGAKEHTVVPGGFEGWTFALNKSSGRAAPGVAPRRPGGATVPSPTPTTAPKRRAAAPSSRTSPTRPMSPTTTTMPTTGAVLTAPAHPSPSRARASRPATTVRSHPSPGPTKHPTKHPTPSAATSPTASASEPLVTGDLPTAAARTPASAPSANGPGWFTALGLGAVVALGAGTAAMARRRRRT